MFSTKSVPLPASSSPPHAAPTPRRATAATSHDRRDPDARSGLHDDRHDHRPALGALADELAGGATDIALQRLDVTDALAQ